MHKQGGPSGWLHHAYASNARRMRAPRTLGHGLLKDQPERGAGVAAQQQRRRAGGLRGGRRRRGRARHGRERRRRQVAVRHADGRPARARAQRAGSGAPGARRWGAGGKLEQPAPRRRDGSRACGMRLCLGRQLRRTGEVVHAGSQPRREQHAALHLRRTGQPRSQLHV